MRTRSRSAEDDTNPDVDQDDDARSELAPEQEPNSKHIACHLAQLFDHSNDIRYHLSGTPEYQDEEPPPSYFAPTAYWTTEEKNAFFHALTVHSRLRPDLIAEEVGSKSLADVCAYLELLEQGLRHSQEDDSEYYPVPRDDFPCAREVSGEWEAFEDTLAEAILANEPTVRAEAFQAARDKEAEEHRLELRAPYRSRGERALGRDREGEKERKRILKDWVKQREIEWKQEDLLNSLNLATMRAMDMLVRETEEARALAADTANQPHEDSLSTSHAPAPEPVYGVVPQPVDFDEELIDPLLRDSSSAPTRVHTPQLAGASRPHTPEPSGSTLYDTFNPVTPPFVHLHPTASSSTLFAPEPESASVEDAASAADPALSPAARRRLRKRMYMRRKRAEKNGGEVDPSATRLKPGRKRKKLPGETDDAEEPSRHPRSSGKTLTYKMRDGLDEAGITIEWMQEEHLDLLHMAGLHKLMRMYNNLHEVPEDVVTEISIQTVQCLRDELVHFIVELVQRTIVSREQEMRAKMQTKAWRLAENQVITTANVTHALSLMGQENASKKPLFENLLTRLGFSEDDIGASEQEAPSQPVSPIRGELEAQDESVGEDNVQPEDETLSASVPSTNPSLDNISVHRAVFPPYIRLPDTLSASDSSQSLLSHIPWAPNPQTEAADDIDMGEESDSDDEEQLEWELREDDKLDGQDGKADAWHEDALWSTFGIDMPKRAVGYGGPRPRKRRRVVKTTEFVPDSEEE